MILLIDGNTLAYRAYFSTSLTTTDGRNVAIPFIGIKSIKETLEAVKPDYALIVWDGGKSKARLACYPQYKALREEKRPKCFDVKDFCSQLNVLVDGVIHVGIDQVKIKDIEADDIIYLLSKITQEPVTICATDKDFFQCLTPKVSILNPTTNKVTSLSNLYATTGARSPVEYLHARIISGDTSDNILGLNRVGMKTALKLLDRYGTIFSLAENAEVMNKTPNSKHILSRNFKLMDLSINPDKLSLEQILKAITPGKYNSSKFREFIFKNEFSSIYMILQEFLIPFKKTKSLISLYKKGDI